MLPLLIAGVAAAVIWELPPVKRFRQELQEEKIKEWKDKYSVSCNKCHDLAEPIDGTFNRYRCSCGNQFSGAHHSGTNGRF